MQVSSCCRSLLGERQEAELEWCVAHDLTACVNEPHVVRALSKIATKFGKQIPVHVKIHTGDGAVAGVLDEALPLIEQIVAVAPLSSGVMTHFSQSDETEKTFCQSAIRAFQRSFARARTKPEKISVKLRHTCNSGGFLDFPHASRHGARGYFALRRFSVARLPENSRHRAGDVGEGKNCGDPKIKIRRSRRLRDALHGDDNGASRFC